MFFFHEYYISLLKALLEKNLAIGGVANYLLRKKGTGAQVILRHDVDRFLNRALELAQLEARFGIKATYYFRAPARLGFPVSYVEKIQKLGHEVAYHYECLSDCRGNRAAALEDFDHKLKEFRTFAECLTVSAHGAPGSVHSNMSFLKEGDFEPRGLLGDAALSLSGDIVYYYTDTGGSWNSRFNMRDYVGAFPYHRDSEPGLSLSPFSLLAAGDIQYPIYINTHPERWTSGYVSGLLSKLQDLILNSAKVLRQRMSRKAET